MKKASSFFSLLFVVGFFDWSRWQEEANGLRLPDDGHYHVWAHGHTVHQGEESLSTRKLQTLDSVHFITTRLLTQHLSPWIPYVNITLIFSVICMYGLGPCTSLALGANILGTHWDCSPFILFSPAGVSMALPADLFLQAWRPSAFVIGGTINFLGMFFIGMCFGYIVVRCQWFAHNIHTKPLTESQPTAVFYRMDSASSASWSLWCTASPALRFWSGTFQRPKERRWWRLWRISINWIMGATQRLLTKLTCNWELNFKWLFFFLRIVTAKCVILPHLHATFEMQFRNRYKRISKLCSLMTCDFILFFLSVDLHPRSWPMSHCGSVLFNLMSITSIQVWIKSASIGYRIHPTNVL